LRGQARRYRCDVQSATVKKSRRRRELIALVVVLLVLPGGGGNASQDVSLPGGSDSVKFAVIGDNGNGSKAEYDVGQQMAAAHAKFPFDLVIMLGDNMYGSQSPQDFVNKFEKPYAGLLESGVTFIASLGNHDNPNNRNYKGFNMGGRRYFTYVRRNVRFFVLDSNAMDRAQVAWLEDALKMSEEDWKICYFHHPIYSNAGRHGSDVELRVVLEPLFTKYGVNVVFAGHDHTYERLNPQKGITYFVEGSSGELAKGDVRPASTTAAAFDSDNAFMLVEISGDEMSFETLSRGGQRVDEGVIKRHP
jgi:3',5'-cyclic AMP phosphodiesterase CpdA